MNSQKQRLESLIEEFGSGATVGDVARQLRRREA